MNNKLASVHYASYVANCVPAYKCGKKIDGTEYSSTNHWPYVTCVDCAKRLTVAEIVQNLTFNQIEAMGLLDVLRIASLARESAQ